MDLQKSTPPGMKSIFKGVLRFDGAANALQVPDAKIKYQQLLFLGKKLPPLSSSQHTDENKVRGCVSQVTKPLKKPPPEQSPSLPAGFKESSFA